MNRVKVVILVGSSTEPTLLALVGIIPTGLP